MIAVESLVEWQRPSEALPESYKNKIVEESKEQLEALHALAQHISSRLHCGGERRENIPQETIAHVYTDLERLNNGTKRFLNIKMYKQFLIYSQAEECKDSFSIWEDFSSKMLLILRTLLAGIIRRETDAVLRIKLARTSTKLLEKPKIFGDHPDFSPPWKDILELLEDFHVRSFDGPTFIGKEVREQHLRSLVALLLCFRYYFDASCEESIFSHPLFRSVSSGTLSDSSIPLFDTLNCEDPVKALEQVATVSLIVPFHSPCILSWVPDAVSFWMKINNSHDWDRLWLVTFTCSVCIDFLFLKASIDWTHCKAAASCNRLDTVYA